MNEKNLNFIHHNNLWFTLIELIVSIFIWSLIIFWISTALITLYQNIAAVDDGISIISYKNEFKTDLEYIKRYYPNLVYMTWWVYGNDMYWFNAIIFEDENSQSWILIWVTDWKKILTWFQEKYDDFHIFYKEIDKTTKDSLISNFDTTFNSENTNIYSGIHPIKFTFLFINNIWKIDITSSWVFYKDWKWNKITDLWNDISVLWYNISFLIP